jgi:hypothetical protein
MMEILRRTGPRLLRMSGHWPLPACLTVKRAGIMAAVICLFRQHFQQLFHRFPSPLDAARAA